MAEAPKFKILVVGPLQSGKTRLTNLLSQIQTQGNYDPTVGCRIVEIDRQITVRNRDTRRDMSVTVQIELWDVSGDTKYESCWPAIQKDAHGVLFVMEPYSFALNDLPQEKELEYWYQAFIHKSSAQLDPSQGCAFLLTAEETQLQPQSAAAIRAKLAKLPNTVSNVQTYHGNQAAIEKEFDSFLARIFYRHPDAGML